MRQRKTDPTAVRTLADPDKADIMSTLRETNWVAGVWNGGAVQNSISQWRTTAVESLPLVLVHPSRGRIDTVPGRRFATILRRWLMQNRTRSALRAMLPSSLRISHMTAEPPSPAIDVRSTAASVCPRRSKTPPGTQRSGNTCPGRARSSGRVPGSIAVRIVCARSRAEIPVVIPGCFASMETLNPVPPNAVLRGTIAGSSNLSSLSLSIARQIKPRP
jgi:hypothetical protein